MRKNSVVAMCPKCTKKDIFPSLSSNRRIYNNEKYELHVCSVCGERYLAHTYGLHSILRFHGDDFMEQMESIIEITPEHCTEFIHQIKECDTEEKLLQAVRRMHGDISPLSNEQYDKMLDTSLLLTEDVLEQIEY